jgi:hypothetical protein
MPVPDLQKLNILAMMHAEFLMLERFYVAPLTKHDMGLNTPRDISSAAFTPSNTENLLSIQ